MSVVHFRSRRASRTAETLALARRTLEQNNLILMGLVMLNCDISQQCKVEIKKQLAKNEACIAELNRLSGTDR